jgi:hypothetical protein
MLVDIEEAVCLTFPFLEANLRLLQSYKSHVRANKGHRGLTQEQMRDLSKPHCTTHMDTHTNTET